MKPCVLLQVFLLLFSAAFICSAQPITITGGSPIPSGAAGTGVQLGTVTSTTGLTLTLNSFDPNAWLAAGGSCASQINSEQITVPAPVVACLGPDIPTGLHYLFYNVTNVQQTVYFALPVNVTPTGSLTLNTSNVSIAGPSTTSTITVTAASGKTIHAVTTSTAQPGVGNWLSVSGNCASEASCTATVTVNPANLSSPVAGTVYLGKVTFTASDNSVAEAEVKYTYEPTTESAITITSSSSFSGLIDEPFTATLTATGGTGTYTWSATDLPAGLSISSSGVISGTVTAANVYQPGIKVTDSLGETQTATLTLTFQSSSSAVPTQLFPHMAADTQWQTNFLIVNPSSAPIAFTLKFHPDAGGTVAIAGTGAVSEVSGTVPARGSVSYMTAATTDSDGWAELDSPVGLSGVAVFQEPANQASVLLSAPATKFTVTFDAGDTGYVDGLAIANADPAHTAVVTCHAYSNTGTAIGGALTVATIAASAHTAFVLQSTSPFSTLPSNENGQLACTSTTMVGVVELRALGAEVSTLPVILGQ